MDSNYFFKQSVTLEFSQDGYCALRDALKRYVDYVNRDTAKDELMDDDFEFISEFVVNLF